MVDGLAVLQGSDGAEGVGVARRYGGVETGDGRCCRVRAYPAPTPVGRQLVEARECLGVVLGVERLHASHEATGSEDPEEQESPLVTASAGPIRPEVRLANQESVGSETEDVVEPDGRVG